MKAFLLPPMVICMLCACAPTPRSTTPTTAPALPSADGSPASTALGENASSPDDEGPSYEVSIASAEADRVRARDLCDSGDKAERRACLQAADAAYDQAKNSAGRTP